MLATAAGCFLKTHKKKTKDINSEGSELALVPGCSGSNPPFFPAWSSQFSKVQGPQAPQGDTWQSIGQGTWQSCEVFGTGPWHRRFSTGRDAAEQEKRSKVMCKKKKKTLNKNLLCFHPIPVLCHYNREVWGGHDGGVEGSFAFIPGSRCHSRDQRWKAVEGGEKKI